MHTFTTRLFLSLVVLVPDSCALRAALCNLLQGASARVRLVESEKTAKLPTLRTLTLWDLWSLQIPHGQFHFHSHFHFQSSRPPTKLRHSPVLWPNADADALLFCIPYSSQPLFASSCLTHRCCLVAPKIWQHTLRKIQPVLSGIVLGDNPGSPVWELLGKRLDVPHQLCHYYPKDRTGAHSYQSAPKSSVRVFVLRCHLSRLPSNVSIPFKCFC